MDVKRLITTVKDISPAIWPALGLVSVVIGLVLLVSTLSSGCGSEEETATDSRPAPPAESRTATTPSTREFSFGTPKKSAHYESNTPAHEAILPAPPINVVIDFNFDLAPPSSISIVSNSKEYGTGETQIDSNKLAMRRPVDPQAPDGLYDVSYTACWPDGSCHDGNFQFAVDRSRASTLTDMRNMPEVTVNMSGISFQPADIIISKGTKVTWVNQDAVEHFVNTDSHPAHTYYPAQNSRGLAQGGNFSVTFTQPGAYPYHCSAHADQMFGLIVVE